MATAKDYPMTENYGCQPGYPLNQNLCPPGQGYHKGIDYGCPVGTPIVVNGVTIGLSGNSGAVTGPHLHVGKFVGGKDTNPGVGSGFQFQSAVVTEISYDNTDGYFVRVQGDGASWVYLHMSNNKLVKVGQELKGGNMPTLVDDGNIDLLYLGTIHRSPKQADKDARRGQEYTKAMQELFESPEWKLQNAALKEPNAAQAKLDQVRQIVN